MEKRTLISVYDKKDIVETAKILNEKFNFKIFATEQTLELLKRNNIESNILSDNINTENFDLIIVNLFPFEKVAKQEHDSELLINNIDIECINYLRIGAKQYKKTAVISNPEQYKELLEDLEINNGNTSDNLRKTFAIEAFTTTSKYDSDILNELSEKSETLYLKKSKDFKYGENQQQKASLFVYKNQIDYKNLTENEISYNNILDATSALNIISEFYDVPACVIVNHTTPCGVALGKSINESYLKAFDADPISVFGGTVAFSRTVDEETAKHASSIYLESIIAPDYTDEAIKILNKNKDIKILKLNTSLRAYKNLVTRNLKITPFGILMQDVDNKELNKDTFNIVTKNKPSAEMIEDMVFAWKISKHVNTNAIVIAKDFKTLAISGGQTSRIDAVENALNKACDGAKDAVMASDGFLPAIDSIQSAIQCRIAGIIQPGGSPKDSDIISQADKYNIVMVNTGVEHIKH